MPQGDDRLAGYLTVLATAMEALGPSSLPYCIIGALALGAWGRPRATYDLDLLVLTESSAPDPYLAPLVSRGFRIDERWRAGNPMARDVVLRLILPAAPSFPVDLIFATAALQQSAVARRREHDLDGVPVWVCSAEDLLLLKLQASRPRDFDDAVTIVMNPAVQLDLDYLWAWADRLGLQGELTYVLRAAAPPSQSAPPPPAAP